MSTPDNTRLLDRAVAGDSDALTELLAQFAGSLRGTLQSRIPARWQAVLSVDDVLQETYIDAFLDIASFDPHGEGAFQAWLHTLANRNLLDALRMLEAEKRGRNHRRVRAPTLEGSLASLFDDLGGSTSTPSRYAARKEACKSVLDALTRLPDTYRQVVDLYDLKGRPIAEVAETLHRSEGAVFMLRARAHRQMSEILGSPSQFLSGGA